MMPRVDVYETDEKVVLVAEMPGVRKEDLKVEVRDNLLKIRGEKTPPSFEGEEVSGEIRYGVYERNFVLSPVLDLGKVSASYENGMLFITLPKREEAKPREIEIK
jgi:HSP20 family molecular chaperone IbpA